MTIRLSTAVRVALAQTIRSAIDAGTGPGVMRVYTGTQPLNADAAPTGTLLVEIPLNDPAGVVTSPDAYLTYDVSPLPTGTAIASGTAGWVRVLDSDSNTIYDGQIDLVTGEFSIDPVTISNGEIVALTSPAILAFVP